MKENSCDSNQTKAGNNFKAAIIAMWQSSSFAAPHYINVQNKWQLIEKPLDSHICGSCPACNDHFAL